LGLRCVLKTKKRVPRAPRPNARLTNAQIAGVRGVAAQALAAGIHTYVVALRASASTDQGGRDPVADGAAIALADGTELFDATSDPDVGAKALATIVTDLGSCVYDQPEGVGLRQNQAATTLSYFDVLTQTKVVIQHHPSA
jgi:hypothetical protein